MPNPYTLPPDSRSVGSPNPPADMNSASDALNAMATAVAGLSGAPGLTSFAGGIASGAPTSGTYTTGQFIVNQDGTVWVCTAGGTSGTWVKAVPPAPYVTVSPVGTSSGTAARNNGATYGPDTAGTTTTGIQEALNSLPPVGGTVWLLPGTFAVTSPITLACDGSVQLIGSGVSSIENNYIGSMPAHIGTMIDVTGLSAGQWAFSFSPLAYPDGNQGSLRLQAFSVRGQPYTYTGSTAGTMNGIQTNYYGPQTQTIDDVKMEYINQAWYLQHPGGGPIVMYKVQNVFCGSATAPSAQLGAESFWCGHWEEFANNSSTLPSIALVAPGEYRFDNMWMNSGTAAIGPVDATSADVIILGIGKLYEYSASAFFINNAGTTVITADAVRVNTGNMGLLKMGGNSGTAIVDVNNLYAAGIYLFGNSFPTNSTIGAGSYLAVKSAYFTAPLVANYAVPAGMFIAAAETGTTVQQAVLTGTTAGSATSYMPAVTAPYKKFLAYLAGYENTTGTAQTVTFPTAFAHVPAITANTSSGATVSATTLTLPASMGAPVTGFVIVEGY